MGSLYVMTIAATVVMQIYYVYDALYLMSLGMFDLNLHAGMLKARP